MLLKEVKAGMKQNFECPCCCLSFACTPTIFILAIMGLCCTTGMFESSASTKRRLQFEIEAVFRSFDRFR